MLIKGEVNKEDIHVFINHFVNTSKKIRNAISILMVIYVVLVAIAAWFIFSSITLFNILVCVILLALIVPFMPGLLRKRTGKVLYRKIEKTNLFQKLGAYVLEIDDKGLVMKGREDKEQRIEWKNIQRIYVEKEHYFIYYGHVIILPVRDFNFERAEFMEWINLHVEQEKIAQKSEKKKNPKIVFASTIAAIFIALLGYYFYETYTQQPEREFAEAANKVVALFDEETQGDETGQSPKKLKASTTQADIDRAMEAVANIDTTKEPYKVYTLPLLALIIELNDAQKQLDER